MRIVAGRWRGRRIEAPTGSLVRPTADRVREAWLSIVQLHIADARVLDLFAGSGALGLESLSRGARHADFVDAHPVSLRTLQANFAALGVPPQQVTVHRSDVLKFLDALGDDVYDLAFADPPYAEPLAAAVAERWLARPFARVLGIEHDSRTPMPAGGDLRRYGVTALTFYRR